MKLINARPSPFGRKVAVALHEKGIPFETMWDEPWGSATCVAAHNPLAQLPILITDDGDELFESTYILEWIERRFPQPPLMPADDDGIMAAKRLMVVAEGIITAWISASVELNRSSPSQAWLARQRHKVTAGTDWIAGQIGDRDFAVRGTFSQADITITANLGLLSFAYDRGGRVEEEHWRDRLPDLGRYVDRLEQRPSFQATRPQPMPAGMREALA